ncbi:hypothetical protein ILUMI_24655 [Ignelater luminosus]|uniref:Uncharacterized protein n=1 Tax=Ignelater luminosus TaxID=2038154 RepID=A0A8K0G0F5_IGNLU|nr:hypothetical protein ILUMI_24655 [Ignelater luminosus]
MNVKITVLVLFHFWTTINGYKILGLFPHPGKSHFDAFRPLLKALAEKGHEVTVISYFPQKNPMKNYKDIDINGELKLHTHAVNVDDFTGARYEKYILPIVLAYFGYRSCDDGLSNKDLHEFLKTKPKFDIVLAEFFNSQCFLGIVHQLNNPPIIGLSSCIVMPWHSIAFGHSSNPAYIPNSFMPFSTHMTFFERVENTVLYLFHQAIFKFLIDIPGQWQARKHLGNDIPDLNDIATNSSLILVNNHFTYTSSRPLVPGYIEVGGMFIGKPKKLPQWGIEKSSSRRFNDIDPVAMVHVGWENVSVPYVSVAD